MPGGSFVPPIRPVSLIAEAPAGRVFGSLATTFFPVVLVVPLIVTTTFAATLSRSFSLVTRGFARAAATWMVFSVSLTPDSTGGTVATGGIGGTGGTAVGPAPGGPRTAGTCPLADSAAAQTATSPSRRRSVVTKYVEPAASPPPRAMV